MILKNFTASVVDAVATADVGVGGVQKDDVAAARKNQADVAGNVTTCHRQRVEVGINATSKRYTVVISIVTRAWTTAASKGAQKTRNVGIASDILSLICPFGVFVCLFV